jgi:hypothetical protein
MATGPFAACLRAAQASVNPSPQAAFDGVMKRDFSRQRQLPNNQVDHNLM